MALIKTISYLGMKLKVTTKITNFPVTKIVKKIIHKTVEGEFPLEVATEEVEAIKYFESRVILDVFNGDTRIPDLEINLEGLKTPYNKEGVVKFRDLYIAIDYRAPKQLEGYKSDDPSPITDEERQAYADFLVSISLNQVDSI